MAEAAAYVSELEARNQDSVRNLVSGYVSLITRENLSVVDVLKLEVKSVVESIELAALWLTDSEHVEMKMALARRCGEGADHFALLGERLAALGTPLATFDARFGGYTKLFAYFRSLQTLEERASAGFVMLGNFMIGRYEGLAALCEEKGDAETARLFRDTLGADEARHVRVGREHLIAAASTEESQARARRSAYRTMELLGEVQDPGQLRKFLSRSVRK